MLFRSPQNPKPQTPNPKPQTPNPKPQTPNPKPQTPINLIFIMKEYRHFFLVIICLSVLTETYFSEINKELLIKQMDRAFGKCKGLNIGKDIGKRDVVNDGNINQQFKEQKVFESNI